VTLAVLWEEYGGHHPDGYGCGRFCDLYVEWRHGSRRLGTDPQGWREAGLTFIGHALMENRNGLIVAATVTNPPVPPSAKRQRR
jgi:hypothetical protein